MKKILTLVFAGLLFASFGAMAMGNEADAAKAIAAAKAELKKAGSMGGAWRDTGKIIKKAEAAAKKGDFATAAKLAKKAEFQGKMGQQQAAEQANVGNAGYLYQ